MKAESEEDREELNLFSLVQECADEDKARAFLESKVWPGGPVCPHCLEQGSECKDVYKIVRKATNTRKERKRLAPPWGRKRKRVGKRRAALEAEKAIARAAKKAAKLAAKALAGGS